MLQILFIVILVLGVLRDTKAQQLDRCGLPNTFIPQIPHVFYIMDLSNPNFRVCPPVNTSQDAVVCISRTVGSGYSRIGSGGEVVASTCMLTDLQVRSFCISSGNFAAIAIQLRALNSSARGFVEVSRSSTQKITFTYGPTLLNSIPLPVQSVPSLTTMGSVVIVDKIFGRVEGTLFFVCDRESLLKREDFVADVGPVTECASANGTASPDSRPSNITLRSVSSSTPMGTVSLFIASSSTCSERITEPFNVTLVNTTDPGISTSQPTMTATSPSILPPGAIGAIAGVAVVGVIVLAVLMALLLVYVLYWRRKNEDNLTPVGTPEESFTTTHSFENGHSHHQPVDPNLSPLPGREDADSGLGSPGPSTPQPNCIVVVLSSSHHPCYQEIMKKLHELFKMPVKELSFPQDASSQHDFELKFYGKEHYKHFFIFRTAQKPIPPALKDFIRVVESRGCSSPKLWIIVFGAPSEAELSNSNINRLSFPQDPENDASSENCAQQIFDAVSKATRDETGNNLASKSLDPRLFAQQKEIDEPSTASAPLPKRGLSQENYHWKELADAQKRQAEATERAAVVTERAAEAFEKLVEISNQHKTDELKSLTMSTKSAVDELHGKFDSIRSTVEHTEAILEDKIIQEQDEQIVEDTCGQSDDT